MTAPRELSVSERVYALMLRLYPRAFREEYGERMRATFADALRDARARLGAAAVAVLWWATIVDGVRSAIREHGEARFEAWRTEMDVAAMAESGSGIGRLRKRRDSVMQDIRWAIRGLIRQPGFAMIAIVTIALGIGANTALFSVSRTVLLQPLPYAEPSELAMIWSRWSNFEKTWVSEPEFHNYRATMRSFEDMSLYATTAASITEGDEPERVNTAVVMPNLWAVLGVVPVAGRGFLEEEAQQNAPGTVMLSYELWQRRYGGDPSAVGRDISINGQPSLIVGVLPAGFRMPLDFRTNAPAQLWFPYSFFVPAGGPVPPNGGSHGTYLIGRLRAGTTVEAANAELRTVVGRLNADGVYPAGWRFEAFAVGVTEEVSGALRPALMILLGAVGFVLLIACANVANLLLVRGEGRRSEIGVRAAVGASRRRLLRQLLAENLALALAGGVLGVGIAWAGLAALRRFAPANLPRMDEVSLDLTVLGFGMALAVATAALFGLVPALQVSRTDARSVIDEGGRANTPGSGRSRTRRVLVALEVALAVTLAIGAGLMLRSFANLTAIDPGFRADNVLTMRVSTPSAFYPDAPSVNGFFAEVVTRVRALPGVQNAGLVRLLPIDQVIGDSCITVDGYTPPQGECAAADWQAASDGYFESIGQPLLEGRTIQATDVSDAPQVIVVNAAFVKKYFADGIALGRSVRFGFTATALPQTVVGVVADVKHNGLTGPVKPAFWRPQAQWQESTGFPQRSVALVVRAVAGDPMALAAPVRSVIRGLDARLPVSSMQSMDEVMARAVAQPQFTLILLLAFGGLALMLAVIGVYGVVSYAVASRRQELGIRMALGAAPRAVVLLSLRYGLTFAIAGIGLGAVASLLLTRFMRNVVYEVTTTDPVTYGVVILVALLVTAGASWIPARRASRADPLSALRSPST